MSLTEALDRIDTCGQFPPGSAFYTVIEAARKLQKAKTYQAACVLDYLLLQQSQSYPMEEVKRQIMFNLAEQLVREAQVYLTRTREYDDSIKFSAKVTLCP